MKIGKFSDTLDFDNAQAADIMSQHLERLLDWGAYFSDSFCIRERHGNISVFASNRDEEQDFIRIPNHLLIPVGNVKLSYRDKKINIDENVNLTDQQFVLLEDIVTLFNLLRKVEQFYQTDLALFGFPNPVSEYINTKLASANGRLVLPNEVLDIERYKLNRFINSRVLAYGKGEAKKIVLMPVLDLLNHYSFAPGFRNDKKGLAVRKVQPYPDTDQCFVNYGAKDPLTLLLRYNFCVSHIHFIASIAVKVELAELGTLVIKSKINNRRDMFYKQALVYRVPKDITLNGSTISCSDIQLSCNKRMDNLYITVSLMVKQLAKISGVIHVDEAIALVIKQVIDRNIDFYQQLLEIAMSMDKGNETKALIENIVSVATKSRAFLQEYAKQIHA